MCMCNSTKILESTFLRKDVIQERIPPSPGVICVSNDIPFSFLVTRQITLCTLLSYAKKGMKSRIRKKVTRVQGLYSKSGYAAT